MYIMLRIHVLHVNAGINTVGSWLTNLLFFAFVACEKNGTRFGQRYHVGIWDNRSQRYTCCDCIRKDQEGCTDLTWRPNNNTTSNSRFNG